MKISFDKKIEGKENLKNFIDITEPAKFWITYLEEKYGDKHGFVSRFLYDTTKIKNNIIESLEKNVKKNGFKAERLNPSQIIILEPDTCALTKLNVELYYKDWEFNYDNGRVANDYISLIRNDKLERLNKTKKGTILELTEGIPLWRREVPMYEEIPQISVNGTLHYECLNPNPKPVLEILKELGYSSKVFMFSQDVEEALNRARGRKNQTGNCYKSESSIVDNILDVISVFGGG